jgi:hypothetical protein
MTTVYYCTKAILLLTFAYLLTKKSAKNETLRGALVISGALTLAGIAIAVAGAIFEGFFLE